MKGQRSRAGSRQKAGFEGGQTPLYMRLPKGRGKKQKFPSQVIKPVAILLSSLRGLEGDIIGPGVLREAGLLENRNQKVKLISGGVLDKKVTVRVHAISQGARVAVEKMGGKVEIIS